MDLIWLTSYGLTAYNTAQVLGQVSHMFIEAYIAIPLMAFAALGIIYLIYLLQRSLGHKQKKQRNIYSLIISAKDRANDIEAIVRDFILDAKMGTIQGELLNILLLDLGSKDDTAAIMKRLSKEYTLVKHIRPEDLTGYIRSLRDY